MKVQPLADNVLIERLEAETKTSGGIVLPDTAKEKPQRGKVINVGKGKILEDGTVRKMQLKKGDLVAFVETEQGVLISPQETIAMDALDRIGKVLKAKGLTLEELRESGREIRGELLEKEYGLESEE